MELVLTILGSIALGVSLAASCGLRAFLPLFLLGLVGRFTDLVDLGDAFEWLTEGPALFALFVGVVCEVIADKAPGFSGFLNLLQTPVRTAAGMLICGAVIVHLPGWVIALLAVILGGGTALAIHVAKSTARLGAGVASAGTSGPPLSLLEDVTCFFAALLSMVFALVAVFVAAIALLVLWVSAKAVWSRTSSRGARRR